MFGYKNKNIVKQSAADSRSLVFSVFFFFCTSCAVSHVSPNIGSSDSTSLNMLPAQLQIGSFTFDQVLLAYDGLNDKQKIVALKYLLGQTTLDDRQKAEAAYMLARLARPADEQTLSLFDLAQTYTPLKAKSLWHKSETAAILGKEKLVRQALSAFVAQTTDKTSMVAAQYALAQSYVRAGETDNARNLLHKIRTDFPGTDYAIGADYYLGTLLYNQFEQKSNSRRNSAQSALESLKSACACYFEYLQASPDGHFSTDILLKLENLASHGLWQAKEDELVLMANAYLATGQYKPSLHYWQRAGINKHLLSVASCLLALKQFASAREIFFKSLTNYSHDKQYLTIANQISSNLNQADCLQFWQQLRRSQFTFQDEVLWNIAIRQCSAGTLRYYQDLIAYYPQSIHAPEAQWWLLWDKYKSAKPDSLPAIAELFFKAANKYSHCPLTPRFAFWAGKIAEQAGNKQRACFYYQQGLALRPTGYYAQRCNYRLNYLAHHIADNYFETKNYLIGTVPPWQYPPPYKAINAIKDGGNLTLYELIYLKQYDEALAEQSGLPAELASWLEGKCGQPAAAINIASKCLEEKSCAAVDINRLWQYSFPLLYNQEIVSNCKRHGNVDSLLVQALVREESRYDPKAVSQTQALGLTQLMPTTANGMAASAGMKAINKELLFEPKLNLALGIAYLAYTLKTFNNKALPAIAAYNAGVGTVKSFIANNKGTVCDPDQFVENFPFRETRDYMRKVFSSYHSYREIYLD